MRRLLLVLALSLGLTVPQVAVTRPAIASVDDCPRGYVCLFRDRDTQGWEHFQLSARSSYGDLRMAPCYICKNGDWNDDMSSWVNNSGIRYCWYFDSYFRGSGSRGPRPMPYQFGRIVNVTSFENDQASSIGPC